MLLDRSANVNKAVANARSPLLRDANEKMEAGRLSDELEALEQRCATVEASVQALHRVHESLRQAAGQLAEAGTLQAAALQAISSAERNGDAEQRTWNTLPEAVDHYAARLQASLGEPASEASDVGEAYRTKRDEFEHASRELKKKVFLALSEAESNSPETGRAQGLLNEEQTLHGPLDAAVRKVASQRLAAVMLAGGRALVTLLDAAPSTDVDQEEQARRLTAARLAQELVRRGLQAMPDDEKLQKTAYDANRVYAELLLALKAYMIFDVELANKGRFTTDDRVLLQRAKDQALAATDALQQALLKVKAELENEDPQRPLSVGALEDDVRYLSVEAKNHPALNDELDGLRRDVLSHAQRLVRTRSRDEVMREVARAEELQNAEDSAGQASKLKDLLATWAAVARQFADRRDQLPPGAAEEGRRFCDRKRAALLHSAARELGAVDPAKSLEHALAAQAIYKELFAEQAVSKAQLEAVGDTVKQLERRSKKPEGMVLVDGRDKVDLGGGPPSDRNGTRTADIKPFYLAIREVTNKEYAEFVTSPTYRDAAFWQRLGVDEADVPPHPQTWQSTTCPAGTEELPVTGICWYEARGYAAYRGQRLPTDDEWEFAARYQSGKLREFPWGEWQEGVLKDRLQPPGSNRADRTTKSVMDMGGNVSEWVVVETKDGSTPGARGASFLYPYRQIATGTHRLLPVAKYRGPQLGLRLAQDS